MGYFIGTGYQSSPYQSSSNDSDVPVSGTPIAGTAGPSLGGIQGSNTAPGSISAPSSVLQNINNFSGSTGTLMGNFNQSQGLQNYNQLAGQYGQYGGQWTPWGLADKSQGGYGDPSQQFSNYFVGNQGAGPIAQGNRYSLQGSLIGSQAINHNAYTGAQSGYGAQNWQMQNGANPLNNFWTGKDPYHVDYNDVQGQINGLTQNYANQMKTQYVGSNDEWADPNINTLGNQLVQGSRPTSGPTNQPLDYWYQYANHQGLTNGTPFSQYMKSWSGGSPLGTIARGY